MCPPPISGPFTLYNVQTRSMLQTDTLYPEISSADGKVQPNADGSYDIYFGPEAPDGQRGELDSDSARHGVAHAVPALWT